MTSSLQMKLNDLLEKHGVVGASVAVLHDGRIDAAASGILNLATGVEATTESLFQIGSITKVWTATILMQLVDEGALDLDLPLTTYLPELKFAETTATEQVTTRHLLAHTSGIDGDHFADTGRGDDVLERYTASLTDLEQVHPVGAAWSYCNSGYSLAGRLIEVLTKKVWDEAIRERLCEPLGLQHTVTLPEDLLRHRAAIGHVQPPGAEELIPTPVPFLTRSAGPAGLICATATDLITFARAHLDALNGLSTVLTTASAQAMLEPQADVPIASSIMGNAWGLGWSLYRWPSGEVIGHDGGTSGQGAFLRIVPEAGVAVALLTNGGPAILELFEELVGELLKNLAGVEFPAPATPPAEPVMVTDPGTITGHYARRGQSVEVVERDGGFVGILRIDGPATSMFGPEIHIPLVAVDPSEGRFLGNMLSLGWSPAVFTTLDDGSRLLYWGGRGLPKVD